MSLRIVFAGTPPIAAVHLQALIDAGMNVVGVYSQPDRPSGRGKKLLPTPVKAVAEQYGLPVYQPLNFKSADNVAELAALNADVMVVVAYGLLLPKTVLEIPRLGCINVHASLLPRWRGAAPIERAIEAGDSITGITIMQMDVGLDTGDMLLVREISIDHQCTGDSLRERMGKEGSLALLATLAQMQAGNLAPVPQQHDQANYAHKLSKEEAQIDWQQPASILDRKIRAFTSANICFGIYNGERIKIWRATPVSIHSGSANPGTITSVSKKGIRVACGAGELLLEIIQLPNANKMEVAAILNGRAGFFVEGSAFE